MLFLIFVTADSLELVDGLKVSKVTRTGKCRSLHRSNLLTAMYSGIYVAVPSSSQPQRHMKASPSSVLLRPTQHTEQQRHSHNSYTITNYQLPKPTRNNQPNYHITQWFETDHLTTSIACLSPATATSTAFPPMTRVPDENTLTRWAEPDSMVTSSKIGTRDIPSTGRRGLGEGLHHTTWDRLAELRGAGGGIGTRFGGVYGYER